MSISVVFLVLATLLLVTVSLFVFNFRHIDLNKKISAPDALNDVYMKVDKLDFYLTQIIDVVGEGATVAKFDAELAKYKDEYGTYTLKELAQAEGMKFKFEILEGNEVYGVVYNYEFKYNAQTSP